MNTLMVVYKIYRVDEKKNSKIVKFNDSTLFTKNTLL